jgi:glycerate kinase
VCAPNAFKGTLTARAAASALARGVRDRGMRALEVPVADGGDGTLDVLLAAAANVTDARVEHHRVTGPLGRSVTARLGWLDSRTAVVELAEAAGLRLLGAERLDPLRATSRGAGELIRIALDGNAARIIVGVGGSASTDGGAGLLQALGARLFDDRGRSIGPGAAGLANVARIDLGSLHPRLRDCAIDVATDVRNPLSGPEGAATVFAPQKGATPDQVVALDAALARFASIAERDAGAAGLAQLPGAGAAGGCGFALALIGARLLPGAALVCDLVGLDAVLEGAAAVITGEGRMDMQTPEGKAPAEVATRAHRRGIPCAAVAGQISAEPPGLFDYAIALESIAGGEDSRRHVRALLRRAAAVAVDRVLPGGTRRPQ